MYKSITMITIVKLYNICKFIVCNTCNEQSIMLFHCPDVDCNGR